MGYLLIQPQLILKCLRLSYLDLCVNQNRTEVLVSLEEIVSPLLYTECVS